MSEEEQIILPSGFKRVEYLQSSGTQWIQTDYCPSNETKIVSDFYFIKAGKNGRFCGNGATYGGGTNIFTLFLSAYGTGAIIFDFGTVRKDKNRHNLSVGRHTISADKNGIVIDGTVALTTNNTEEFQSTHPMSIFAGGGETSQDGDYWRIYNFIIYENDEVVRHFIPCLNENDEPCMYDVINKNAYTNAGTGEFYYPRNYHSTNYNLPADFKKCVYLQSDGTQWINTQVVPNTETGFYFRALQLSYGNFIPFGAAESSNSLYPPRYNNKELHYRWGPTNIKIMTWDKADDLIFSSYLNFYNSKFAYFDSSDTDVESYITSQTGTFTIPIWLFSYNSSGSYNTTYGKWIGRIYRAQITQGDSLIRDFVPCLDADNRPCMYDLVTQEAYYNQSGGTEFSYCVEHELPSDFVKLKYLESDGTQFIKTAYVPTNTTGLYIDAYNTNLITSSVLPMGMRETNGNTYFTAPRTAKASEAGFGWGSFTSPGGKGDVRYEGTLNWINDRKAILSSPAFAQRVNSLSTLSFTPLKDIYIFGIHNYDGKYLAGSWRIYRAKISEGSEVVRDYIPALDVRLFKPCMYDLINNVAYYNDGDEEFIYTRDFEGTYKGYTGLGCIGNKLGSDYDPINEKIPSGYKRVDFLESTGQQLIYIPYEGNGYTGLYIKGRLGRDVETHPVPIRPFVVVDGSYSVTQNKISLVSPVWANRTNWLYGWGKYDSDFSTNVISGASHDIVECSINWNSFKDAKLKNCITGKEHYKSTHSDAWVWGPDPDNDLNYPFYDLSLFGSCNKDLSKITYCKFAIYNAQIRQNHEGCTMNLIPVIDDKGKPAMFDSVSKQTFYEVSSNNTFIIGLKTLSQAIQLLLPDIGGSIQLSLPTNDNTEYYEAKIRANNPNWEITFYYH